MALTIDNLEIQIETKATKAKSGLDSLADSLEKLKVAVGDTSGLAMNLKGIANALNTFSAVGKIRMTIPVNQLKKLESVIPTLGSAKATKMADNLRKIADSIATFSATSNVGNQMKEAARGMDALAKSSQKYKAAIKNSDNAHKSTLRYMSEFVNQYRRLYRVIDEVVDVFADLFNESNEYVEALNLFKVSMGDASDAALEYADTVSAAMGIDPAEWISNQGTFQRMATGFGIASDEAEIMSRNLTQLAYDMSSFFNTDVKTATEKLQSGMSGQIKGLKAWGYNLSVAALQQTALSIGIEESVSNMTEAQKAQLRYITLIQRSNGVMGDMAKTINTPANAMRVLDAQITQLKRSLGNIVSIIATSVIPYIQAFVEIMADAADALAEAWGFEIEDLPTNNLEMASEVIDGIGDDIDDTSDAVAGLKKQLAGFDELNILKSDNEDDKNEAQNSLNIKLPEYDFLANLDTKTRERIDEIKEKIKELLPLLETLATAFALAFATKTISDMGIALGKFFTTTSAGETIALSAMLAFDKFKATLKATKNPLKALGSAGKEVWNNFKGMMSSLSPLAKTLVLIVALGVEFKVVKDNIKEAVTGTKSWGEALLAIIPTCGLVGAAMYAMLGPWGLVATIVVGATAAVVGFAQAENEMRKQLVNDQFYDGYGKKVSDLAKEFDNLLSSTTRAYDVILEKQSELSVVEDNISDTKTEIQLLISEVANGATTIEEAIPRMTEAFESLYNDSKTYLVGTASLLYAALTGSTLEGIETYMQTISSVLGDAMNEMDESKERLEQAKKDLDAGIIGEDTYWQILIEENAKVSSLTSAKSNLEDNVSNTLSGLSKLFSKGIDWESDNLFSDLSEIANSAEGAKATITEAYSDIYKAIKDYRDLAERLGKTEAVGIFDNMLAEYKAFEQADLSKVDNMLNGVLYGLQENLANKMYGKYDTTLKDYEKLPWIKKLLYGFNAGNYANERLNDFKDTVSPILDELKKVFGDEAIFVDDVINKISGVIDSGADWTVYHQSAEGLGIKEAFEAAGKDSVDGLISGFTSEQQAAYDEARNLGLSVLEAYDEALDINSPSVEMEKRGEYTLQGLVNGLSNTSLLEVAIDTIVEQFDILDSIKELWKQVTTWWQNISLPDVALKMPHFEWTTTPAEGWISKTLSALGLPTSLPKLNVSWYASGGFPSMGEMFIARERGPELVGRIGNKNAVANNEQIISGIASAVYSAMMAAKEDGEGGGSTARIVVQVGETAIGEAAVKFINGQIIQTGMNPIYS